MSLKKVWMVLFALILVFSACSDDDVTGGGATITLDADTFSAITNQLSNPGQVTILETDAAWDMEAGNPLVGAAVVADFAGSDKAYVALVPAMIKQSFQTVFMTNSTTLAGQASWVTGWAMEALNGASTTVVDGWFNDYKPFCIGELGGAYSDAADSIGNFYGQPALLMKKSTVQFNGQDVYVATISKARALGVLSAWGNPSAFDFKFGFQSRGDAAAVNDGTTVGYVCAPSKNFGATTASIPFWNKADVLRLATINPTNNTPTVVPGADVILTFVTPMTNGTVSGGNLAASVTLTLNDGTSDVLVNDGGNVTAALSSADTVLTLSGISLDPAKTYTLTISGILGDAGQSLESAISLSFTTVTPNLTLEYANVQVSSSDYTGNVCMAGELMGWNATDTNPSTAALTAGDGSVVVYVAPATLAAGFTNSFKVVVADGSWTSVDNGDDGSGGNRTIEVAAGFDPVTQKLVFEGSTGDWTATAK